MSSTSVATPMSESQPRTVTGGRVEGDVFVIVLDGGQEVETKDEHIAHAAANSKRQGKAIRVELEQREGARPQLLELQVVAQAETPEPRRSAETTVATRQPTAMSTPAPRLPTGLISRPEELSAQLQAMAQHYNVLSPAIAVSEMAPGFGANLAVVQIDPSVQFESGENGPTSGTGPDCYWSRTTHGADTSKRSLNKSGLQKIAQALGIQWDHNACRRLDNGRERNYWLWKYVGYVRTHDGQRQTVEGTRELDLRDGSAEAAGMRAKQLQQQRAMGNQLCETKAMQRAIRTFVRQVYTVDELKKPFVIVRFSFTPDMNDPEIKKLVTQNAMAGIGALYAAPPAAALPPPPPEPEADPQDATDETASASRPDPFADAPAAVSPANAPADPPGVTRVAQVDKRSGKVKSGKRAGDTWTLWKVTFANGQIATTFSETVGAQVEKAKAENLPVRYQTEEADGDYDDKLTSFEIVDTRQGALPMGEEAKY